MTEHTNTPEIGHVTITRIFDAPREMSFRAFIEPEQLTHWWGPVGITTPVPSITIDPRPGGVFETVMVSDSSLERLAKHLAKTGPAANREGGER